MELSDEEQKVYQALNIGIISLEDICKEIDRNTDDVISLLMLLQIRGLIGQDEYGDYFVIKTK
jgi:hypothetical protein